MSSSTSKAKLSIDSSDRVGKTEASWVATVMRLMYRCTPGRMMGGRSVRAKTIEVGDIIGGASIETTAIP
jgi:hypothetical protein